MSGTTTSTTTGTDITGLIGDDLLGDEETANVNATLDEADEGLDDAQVTAVDPAKLEIVERANAAFAEGRDALRALGEAVAEGSPVSGFLEGLEAAVARAEEQAEEVAAALPDDRAFAWLKPANNSGGQALATLSADGEDRLQASIVGAGFAPGGTVTITLSGFEDGRAAGLATVAQDANGDGLIDPAEAAEAEGEPLLTLGTATVDAEGNFVFTATQDIPEDLADRLADGLGGLHLGISGPPVRPADAGTDSVTGGEDTTAGGTGTGTTSTDSVTGSGDAADDGAAPPATLPLAGGLLAQPEGDLGAILETISAADPALLLDSMGVLLRQQAPYLQDPTTGEARAEEDPALAEAEVTDFVALIAPANNSGVEGAARFRLDEERGRLDVDMHLSGLTPGEEHPIHIHGQPDGSRSLVPTAREDADGDGFLELAEVVDVLGPVLLALTADGSLSDADLLADFPVADADGRLRLEQTYNFDLGNPAEAAAFELLEERLAGRQIEIHGMELTAEQGAGTPGEVDGEAGYNIAVPVASGAILPVLGLPGGLGDLLAGLMMEGGTAGMAGADGLDGEDGQDRGSDFAALLERLTGAAEDEAMAGQRLAAEEAAADEAVAQSPAMGGTTPGDDLIA